VHKPGVASWPAATCELTFAFEDGHREKMKISPTRLDGLDYGMILWHGRFMIASRQPFSCFLAGMVALLKDPNEREAAVLKYVRVEGVVSNTKQPQIAGVDVEMPSKPIPGSTGREVHDLRAPCVGGGHFSSPNRSS